METPISVIRIPVTVQSIAGQEGERERERDRRKLEERDMGGERVSRWVKECRGEIWNREKIEVMVN